VYYDTLSAHTVKITMTRQDMRDYAIKSENLRARNSESKRSLTRFLERFRSESALFPDRSADRLFLEAFPSDDGGCVMYVSTLGTDTLPDTGGRPASASLMAITESLGDISRLAAALDGRVSSSALYRIQGGWCLVMSAARSDTASLARIIGEYGEFSDDVIDISCAAEHGSLICPDNAAAVLSRLI